MPKLSPTAQALLEKIRTYGGRWSTTIERRGRGAHAYWAGGREFKALKELVEAGYAERTHLERDVEKWAGKSARTFITMSAKLV